MTETKRRYFIPAAPGFWELTYLDAASGGPEATREPVVAWEMIDDGVTVRRTDPGSPNAWFNISTEAWLLVDRARRERNSWRVD